MLTTEVFNSMNLQPNQKVKITLTGNKVLEGILLENRVKKGYDTTYKNIGDYIKIRLLHIASEIDNEEAETDEEIEMAKILAISAIPN